MRRNANRCIRRTECAGSDEAARARVDGRYYEHGPRERGYGDEPPASNDCTREEDRRNHAVPIVGRRLAPAGAPAARTPRAPSDLGVLDGEAAVRNAIPVVEAERAR